MNLLPGEVVGTGAETLVRLDNGGMARSHVPTQVSDKGMKVKVGVRPEDFHETEGDAIFTGEVEITEALGEVTLLYFKKQGEAAQVVAKLPGIRSELRYQTVKLTADPKKVHLFANGKSLLYR
jgi:alpha-glucoside transport system ATP-binding protein